VAGRNGHGGTRLGANLGRRRAWQGAPVRRGRRGAVGRKERGWARIELAKRRADAKIAHEERRIHNEIAMMAK